MRPAPTVGLVLGIAAAGLRLPHALGDAFWQDEVASARVVREPTLAAMLHQVVRTESTPPLWYGLAWLTHKAGVSIHDVRLLSVAFDALIVFAAVQVAARLMPLSLAAAVGVLLAVAGQLSAHGRELRAYELFVLLCVAFCLALYNAALDPTRLRLAVLGATTAAGLLTHYFFAFTLAAGLLWLWFEPGARTARRRALTAVGLGSLACSPWLPAFVAQYRHDRFSWIGPFNGREVLGTPLLLFSPALMTPAAASIVVLWLLGGVWLALRRGPLHRLCASLALVPLALAALAWLLGARVYAVRNMVGIAPFVGIALVLPLAALPARSRLVPTLALVAAAASAFVMGQKPNPPFNSIAQALVRDGWRPHDAVLVARNYHAYRSPLEWYLPHVPVLVAKPLSDLKHAVAYAVLPERALPRRLTAHATRVGAYVIGRFPIWMANRFDPHGVVLEPHRADRNRARRRQPSRAALRT